jgi:hypothetical protein
VHAAPCADDGDRIAQGDASARTPNLPHRGTSSPWSRRSRPNTASSRRWHWPSSKPSRDSMSLRCRRATPRG